MRAVVATRNATDPRGIRQVLLGAGVDCGVIDSVSWQDLGVRLARGPANLVVVHIEEEDEAASRAISEATSLTGAPVIAVGPAKDGIKKLATGAGAVEYIGEGNLRADFDRLIERLCEAQTVQMRRGLVVSVFAPTPGSGASTIGANLAGGFAKRFPQETGLVEFSRDHGDMAVLLNLTPEHPIDSVCLRWKSLDMASLRLCFLPHAAGLNVLANSPEAANTHLSSDAARRVLVLSRALYAASVVVLDSRLGDEEIEAMKLSDLVLMVVRPDVPAVRRTQWAIQQMTDRGVPAESLRLIVNRYGQAGQLKLKQIESNVGMRALQLIPDDPSRVNAAANQGKLLQELGWSSRISRSFQTLAAALASKTLQVA